MVTLIHTDFSSTHTHIHTVPLLLPPTDEVEMLFGLVEVKAGPC